MIRQSVSEVIIGKIKIESRLERIISTTSFVLHRSVFLLVSPNSFLTLRTNDKSEQSMEATIVLVSITSLALLSNSSQTKRIYGELSFGLLAIIKSYFLTVT